jgi:hypothetical protein
VSGFQSLLDNHRRLTQVQVTQIVVFDARHLDVDVIAIEQRPGNTIFVLGDRSSAASAGLTGSL